MYTLILIGGIVWMMLAVLVGNYVGELTHSGMFAAAAFSIFLLLPVSLLLDFS